MNGRIYPTSAAHTRAACIAVAGIAVIVAAAASTGDGPAAVAVTSGIVAVAAVVTAVRAARNAIIVTDTTIGQRGPYRTRTCDTADIVLVTRGHTSSVYAGNADHLTVWTSTTRPYPIASRIAAIGINDTDRHRLATARLRPHLVINDSELSAAGRAHLAQKLGHLIQPIR